MSTRRDSALRRIADTARFWLVDLWGGDWDWHRRRLLFKHYIAYFRNPDIPPAYLPDPEPQDVPRSPVGRDGHGELVAPDRAAGRDIPSPPSGGEGRGAGVSAEATAQQRAFTDAFRSKIECVQRSASRTSGVHLTYRPLGKNLRLLGTAIRENVDRGRRVFIEPDGPATERRALQHKGHDWSPWVWIRPAAREQTHDAARAWNELFRNPPARGDAGERRDPIEVPRLTTGAGPFDPSDLEHVLKVAVATRYVFAPADPIMARIAALKREAGWPADRPVLGIHVRRGDAASAANENGAPTRSTRKSFPLETYLETADTICGRYGIRDVFLATESRAEIERAMQLRPRYRFLWIDYDRSIFPDITKSSQFIEDLALEHPHRARDLAVSAILDLYFFCECDAFIGAFNSEFSVLGWLLAIGSRGHVIPYVSLSRAAGRRSMNPFNALLNLRNNCPLELYHW